jgi:glutamate/tyrosine decarboxylase-like PLP-dependent enzyme
MEYSTGNNQLLLSALSKQFIDFHCELEQREVASKNLHIQLPKISNQGLDFKDLNRLISEQVLPNLSASNGGRYWGFVTGGANPIATYADWLVTTYNQNVSIGGDSLASSIEQQTLQSLCELFELPDTFKGVFTTGATAANLLGAFTARQFTGQQQGIDVAKSGMKDLDVSIYSATPHASMLKSLAMAGFGQDSCLPVECDLDSESMNIASLEQALVTNSHKSAIVIASAATVTGTDYDNLVGVAEVCHKYDAWLHVDAAFGIFERLVNGKQGKTNGLELADSITLDCHKWLNVPYDCGVFLTRHQKLLQQSCEVSAPYLKNAEKEIPFMSLGIENSRRFRAFPVWATLQAYGKQGIKKEIQSNINQAKTIANWIDDSEYYELVKPCDLNVVLFKPNLEKLGIDSQQCMNRLNDSGQVFLTPGVWLGEPIIRVAISNWSTTDKDVEKVIQLLEVTANDLC